MTDDWCCIAAVNDEAVFAANLAASPALRALPGRLMAIRGAASAGAAYNRGLDATAAALVVFAHQDVYLPRGWQDRLAAGIAAVGRADPDWAVAGLFGRRRDGRYAGHVWTSGLGRELGGPFAAPEPVASLDELVIVLRRDSGLRFDEGLPGFHLYGADIVQTALAAGRGAYVIDAPVVHNSVPVRTLAGAFLKAHDHMRRKWRARLPILTTVGPVTRFGVKIRLQILRRYGLGRRRAEALRAADQLRPRRDPAEIARALGYE
jgi:hypothetical protein